MNDSNIVMQTNLSNMLKISQWTRANELSVHSIFILIECGKRSVMAQDMVNSGLYCNNCSSIMALSKLVKRGLIDKIGKSYHLTGKGEILLHSFYAYCEDHLRVNPIQ
jgi:predicted transcriptional regulator